ncbi:MAG: hypothetical protein ACKV2Q_00665 [Planctomycetaceae bacterium]
MPVKVRCSSCEKVFAAPDAARGKLVKCPGCEEKVKVPAGDGAKAGTAGKPASKKPAPAKVKKDEHHDDHEHALKSLDLDNVEDENTRVCPKCGQELFEEEASECPACGLNFETGLTKEKQKGVDPKGFFKVAFKDSKRFLAENKSLAIRTGIYTLIYSVLNFCCFFMVTWVVSFPPRLFWMGLTFITGMVPFGWLWFLNGEIITATMDKRETMPRINFDMFTCVALGIKWLLWLTAISTQLVIPLLAVFLAYKRMLIPAAALGGVSALLIAVMIPQVMVHMTMPVTLRGWLMHVQFQALGKSLKASLYWVAITFVVMLPTLLPVGLGCAIGRQGVIEFSAAMAFNFKTNSLLGADLAVYTAKKNNPKKNEVIEEVKLDDPKYQTRSLPWKGFIIPGIGILLTQGMFGFGAVFAMRANGLFGLYYKKLIKLDTMAKELVWLANDPTAPKRKQALLLIKTGIGGIGSALPLWGVKWMQEAESGNLYGLFSLGSFSLGLVILITGGIMLAVANNARDKFIKESAKAAKK